jgi:aminoglycoside phosphotransferase (APT) family kinase protein
MVAEEYFARAESEIAPKLPPLDAIALIKQFEIYLSESENLLFQPAVLHADLGRDHILAENDSVTAVIDFGDVNWGDPDYDFMYLCARRCRNSARTMNGIPICVTQRRGLAYLFEGEAYFSKKPFSFPLLWVVRRKSS